MTRKIYEENRSICSAAWKGVWIGKNLNIKPCCQSLGSYGQLSNVDITQAFKSLRIQMLNDEKPAGCKPCYDRELTDDIDTDGIPMNSQRWYYNTNHQTDYYLDDKHDLEYLDVRWNNTCNFSCVYCSPYFSSQWAEIQGLKNHSFNIDNQNLTSVLDRLSKLKVLFLAGGEPLMIKENLLLLEKLYEVNPQCNIEITSNISLLDSKIYNQLLRFNNVKWWVSFENTGVKWEYIRRGGSWNTFNHNLQRLITDFSNVNFNMVHFLLSANDWSQTLDFALKYVNESNIVIADLYQWEELSPAQLDQKNLDLLNKKILKVADQLQSVYLKESLSNQVNKYQTAKTTFRYKSFLDKFDQQKNTNWKNTFPEINI